MTHRYSLRPGANQTMTVRVVSDDATVRFDVIARGVFNSRQLSEEGGVRSWSGILPMDADNLIEVHATENTSRYTLEVVLR